MRRKFNDGQEVIFQDFNKMGAAVEGELYDRVIFELIQRAENSFFADGFNVIYSAPTTVSVNAGVGFQTDATQVAPEPKKRLLYRAAALPINLVAPHATLNRIDLIVCKAARVDGAPETRKYKAPIGTISNESLVVSEDWESEIIAVEGTPHATPVAPTVPTGYIKLSECLVTAVSGMSGSGAITDFRILLPVGGSATINTLTAVKITASAALSIQQAILQLDELARYGKIDYNDFEDLVSDPAAPAAGIVRVYNKAGILFGRDNTTLAPIGSGALDTTTNFTIANNATSAAITGLLFDLATFRAVEIEYSIYRKTDSPIEVAAMGKLRLVAKPVANSWDILPGLEEGDDCGMTFIADVSVPGSVQLRYTSTNLAGASYVGTLRYKIFRYIS